LSDTAFDQLVSEYLKMRTELVRFLTARLGQAGLAEDVYQEMFIRLRLGQLPSDIGSPRAFLYKMAYNLANDAHRAGQRRALRDSAWVDTSTQKIGADTVTDAPDADAAIDAKRRLNLMLASLTELPAKCREVFTLHRLLGMSHREVAAHLGISTKTVEKHMTTALKQLAVKLGRRDGQATTSSKGKTQGGGQHGT
jgi:RNA polymerase sigma-70 factor (ECF subfamily)